MTSDSFQQIKNLLGRISTDNYSTTLTRVFRRTQAIRHSMTPGELVGMIQSFSAQVDMTPEQDATCQLALDRFSQVTSLGTPKPMDTASDESEPNSESTTSRSEFTPEKEFYVLYASILYFHDQELWNDAKILASRGYARLGCVKSPFLDPLSAKIYFYYARCHENPSVGNNLSLIRNSLMMRFRTHTLRGNAETQAVLLNILIRSYILQNQYSHASQLISKTSWPEDASNNQIARYYYYLGLIRAIQSKYQDSFDFCLQALRKCPAKGVLGFRLAILKLSCMVQLIMGDLPERKIFSNKSFKDHLVPYLQLCRSVRSGNLDQYTRVMTDHHQTFKNDRVYSLVTRVRHTVIIAGLRQICAAYSHITLNEIQNKLGLEGSISSEAALVEQVKQKLQSFSNSPSKSSASLVLDKKTTNQALVDDAASLVSKSIHDGFLKAKINFDTQTVSTSTINNIYSSVEPQESLHSRIIFCNNLYKDSVQSLQYQPTQKPDYNEEDDHNPEEIVEEILEELGLQ